MQEGDHTYFKAKVAAGEHTVGDSTHLGEDEVNVLCTSDSKKDGGASKVEMMKTLLAHGARLDRTGRDQRQALFSCANTGQWELIPFFKGQPDSVLNSASKHGQPGLHIAVKKGLHKTVEAMLAIGADPHAKATPGGSPYLKAKHDGDAAMKKLFNIPLEAKNEL